MTLVGDADAPRTAVILHGILGCGRNWRSMARRLVNAAPDGAWNVMLVDLRGHGDSFVDRAEAPPAHTLSACARDVMRLVANTSGRVDILIGHSFGGKVALTYARDYGRTQHVAHVWILDSPPGLSLGPGGDVAVVLETLRAMKMPIAGREILRERFEAAGIGHLAGWMSTNLRSVTGASGRGFGWRFDLGIVNALLLDYQRRNLWTYLNERDDSLVVHLVVASRGGRWSDEERTSLKGVEHRTDTLVHELDVGHWLHVEDPQGVAHMLESSFTQAAFRAEAIA
jgi:pimeloyl-ACP methyl ester carboxylesterase